MGAIENLPWRICNNSQDVCELMFIEEPYAGSIFIDRDNEITGVCQHKDELARVKIFEKGTNIKMVEHWIKEELNIL